MAPAGEAARAVGGVSVVRILVFGGRDYSDRGAVFRALDIAFAKFPLLFVVSGMAPGADLLAAEWAKSNPVGLIEFPAHWYRHGRKAGPLRNQRMLDVRPRGAIGFPGGRGTLDMATKLHADGVIVWWPEGGNPLQP